MNDKPQLTKRELEVLKYKAMGLTREEIAQKLYIGITTVEHHWNGVLVELGCQGNSIKAIYKAYELGLITPPLHGQLKEALESIKQAKKLATRASELITNFNQSIEV